MTFGMPCRARQRTTHSRNGLPATGTIGLGTPGSRCATLVPNPPASTTATTWLSSRLMPPAQTLEYMLFRRIVNPLINSRMPRSRPHSGLNPVPAIRALDTM